MELDSATDLFDGERIESIIFNNGRILDDKMFISSTFVDCDFSNAEITNCVFSDCDFINCNLSMCNLKGTKIDDVSFKDCQLMGIDFTVMRWPKIARKKGKFAVSFDHCVLNYSIFIGMNMYMAHFTDCSLKEVCFEETDLEKAVFDNVDLSSAIFNNTNLSGADLLKAANYNINPGTNRLTKAKFSLPEAMLLLYSMDIEII